MAGTKNATVVLFDVDNTLLDNDRVTADLRHHLEAELGADARDRYFAIFEDLRRELGYADYLGTLQRYREENPRDPRLVTVSYFLLGYPFADRLYPDALRVVEACGAWALPVILTDGDVVFQPHKIETSGLLRAFAGRVLLYIHKEKMLDDAESRYPADHYVFVDDKLRLLTAIKNVWGRRVTTVFPRQGHYAHDPEVLGKYPPPDVTIERIGDFTKFTAAGLRGLAGGGK